MCILHTRNRIAHVRLSPEGEARYAKAYSSRVAVPREGAVVIPPPRTSRPVTLDRPPPESDSESQEDTGAEPDERYTGPRTFTGFLSEGDRRFGEGDFREAIRYYREALRKRPGSPVALYAIAHGQFASGEYDLASTAMYDALHRWPGLIDVTREIRMLYPDDETFERGLGALQTRVRQRPGDVRGRFLAGVMRCLDGDEEQAELLLRSALALRPQNPVLSEQVQRLAEESSPDSDEPHGSERPQ